MINDYRPLAAKMTSKLPLITLEELFISQAVVDYYKDEGIETSLPHTMSHVMTSLQEVGPKRLKDMDAGRVSLQVVSHQPNTIPEKPPKNSTGVYPSWIPWAA